MSINLVKHGMRVDLYSIRQRETQGSAPSEKSSVANPTRVGLGKVEVTYKNFSQCNGLLFSLILHAPAIREWAEMDRELAVREWRMTGIKPTRNSGPISLH
jgi:hypothetical protein